MKQVFRTSTLIFGALVVVSVFAVSSTISDDASWGDRFIAFSVAVNPWMISAMIVWATGEIIGARSDGES